MSTLFNFVTVRNPRKPTSVEEETGFIRYDEAIEAPLLEKVVEARSSGDAGDVHRMLREVVASEDLPDSDEALRDRFPDLYGWAEWLAARAGRVSWQEVDERRSAVPLEPDADTVRALWDQVAVSTYGGGDPQVRETTLWALRALQLLAVDEEERGDDADCRRIATATVLLPSAIHGPIARELPVEDPPPPPGDQPDVADAGVRLAAMQRAVEVMERIYEVTADRAHLEHVDPPFIPGAFGARAQGDCETEPPPSKPAGAGSKKASDAKAQGPNEEAEPGSEGASGPAVIDQRMLGQLDEEAREVLTSLGLEQGDRLGFAIEEVERAARQLGTAVWKDTTAARTVVQAGGAFWLRGDRSSPVAEQASTWTQDAPSAAQVGETTSAYHEAVKRMDSHDVAFTHGLTAVRGRECQVRPLGIGDFRRVEQDLCCYEPGEVAHIENVLQGETKERKTRRLRATEAFVSTVTEEEVTDERDTQTTDRYEMERETSKVVKEDLSFEIGVNIAAQYGPVKITADTKFATSTSTTTSDRIAAKFGKEVTDKAVSRVVSKVREERSLKTVEEFEENNLHRLTNEDGDDHIVGLYRWADKIYEAKVVNYGKRLMFEFLVPEPAAFHLHAMAEEPVEGSLRVERPIDPRTHEAQTVFEMPRLATPNEVTTVNYAAWAAAYGAQVEPPPAFEMTTAKAYHRDGMDHTIQFADSKNDLVVPDGYEASFFRCVFGLHSQNHSGGNNWVTVVVGRRSHHATGGGSFSDWLDSEDDVVPVAVMGRTRFYAVSVQVDTRRTPEALMRWKIRTFDAILRAYQEQQAAYEAALSEAKAQAQMGVQIRGQNPLLNRITEQTELRKGAIRLLTRCATLPSHAVYDGDACGYPTFDCCTAIRDGEIVQFFEQLFEWPLITYAFYPYFWGRHCNWRAIYQLDDVDPIFMQFLKAGFARVIVPVREGYERAALRFLADGSLWDGDDAPGIDSPLYVAIENELKEPVGIVDPDIAPWEIRVPTSLTVLQCGSSCVEGTGLPCPCQDEVADVVEPDPAEDVEPGPAEDEEPDLAEDEEPDPAEDVEPVPADA